MLLQRERLYLIADSGRLTRRGLETAVAEAVSSGVRLVQLREKHLDDPSYRTLALRLRRVTREHGARLLLNGRVALVCDVEADGVHLPANAPIANFREMLGESLLWGVSVHSLEELRHAEENGADFVTLSPVFETASKPGTPPLGLDVLARWVEGCRVPVYALGGVTPERAGLCLSAGAFGVAVVSGILDAPDVSEAVRRYFHALRNAL